MVYNFMQDRKVGMLIAMKNGLNRCDGCNFNVSAHLRRHYEKKTTDLLLHFRLLP